MKKLTFIAIGAFILFSLGGCVESSSKYKALQAQLDSLSNTYSAQNTEMETMFAGLNDIAAGMQSIREAENLLAMESTGEKGPGNRSKQQIAQLKNDISAISSAIEGYKAQIAKLEGKNKAQSAEFKKFIAGLNEELDLRTQKIAEITAQLGEKNMQLAEKTKEVEGLNKNVDNLNKETANQKETISQQDQAIHQVNYLIGSRKELKDANVISRHGLFSPPIVSSQAQKANFKSIDMRQVKEIPLNAKKAKVLSTHPEGTYILEEGEGGTLTLKITDENGFWKQSKYLVVMVN